MAELLQSHTPEILSLIDHSSLGTPTFVQRRDISFHYPRRRFWSSPKPRYPTPDYDSLWDLEPYRPPSERLPPSRPGPQTWLTDYQRLVIPDQSFVRRRKLPPLRWDQHSVPGLPANPLAEHGSQPSSPLSVSTDSTLPDHPLPRRSTRIAQRAPPPVAEHWQPPGRPPDMQLRSSSPLVGLPGVDLYDPQFDLRPLERWALGLTQTEPP